MSISQLTREFICRPLLVDNGLRPFSDPPIT